MESFGGYQSTILTVTNFNNSGTISLDNALAGDNFTLDGNYMGNNGYLLLNTELNDDNSASDLLYITGSTSGSTYVTINNVGGMGAATLNGIRVIQIGGESNGEFIQTGRIVAGAYDYWLTKASNNKDWKLISTFIAAEKPEIITQPIESIPTEALTLPIEPALSTETKISTEPTLIEESVAIERPELGIYSASLSTANTLFMPSLQDRKGVAQEVGVALRIFQPFGIMQAQSQTTNTKRLNNLWIRSEGRHQQINDTHAQLKTQSNSYVFQLGKDLVQWVEQKVARFSFGVMAGYGESRSNTHSSLSHYNAEGMLRGYSFGVYGLGGANTVDNTGLYVDTWLMYSLFNNTVSGEGLASEQYKLKGITSSIEAGYTLKLAENTTKNIAYFIQPSVQLIWMGIKPDIHYEANGTEVKGIGDGNIQSRVGIRLLINGVNVQSTDKNSLFYSYIEANWNHNSKDFGVSANGVISTQKGKKDTGELKFGIEGQLNNQLNIWGNVGYQIGSHGYHDSILMLGVNYQF